MTILNTGKKESGLSLKANMIWNSSGSLFYLGCQWLITVFVVRLSNGFDAAGTLSLAMSVYNMFSSLAIYRMYTYQVSDVKHENTLGEYFAFRIMTCGIALAAITVYSFFTCPAEALLAILSYALYKAVGLLIDVFHGLDQINDRMDYIGKSLMMQGLVSLALFLAGMLLFEDVAITLLIMLLGIALIGFFYDLPRATRFERLKVGIEWRKARHLLVYCFPIVVAAIACGAAASIPRQYLSFYDGAAALGVYSSVAAPVAVIQMGASYIYNPLLSRFSKSYVEGRYGHLLQLLLCAGAGIALVGVFATLLLELFGQSILVLMFGEEISSYAYLLTPIIACSMLTAYAWFLNDVLVALRLFGGSFLGNVIAATASIPSSLLLIPLFGMNGVSFAIIVGYGMGSLFMLIRILLRLKRSASVGHEPRHLSVDG